MIKSISVKQSLKRDLYIPFEPMLRPKIRGKQRDWNKQEFITSEAQSTEIEEFSGSVTNKLQEALYSRFKKIFKQSTDQNKTPIKSHDLLGQLSTPVMKVVDADGRYFFYVVGNQLNKHGKGKSVLSVSEFFLDPSEDLVQHT